MSQSPPYRRNKGLQAKCEAKISLYITVVSSGFLKGSLGIICHKNLCRYIYTDTGQLPREGPYGIGDSFIEQGEGFGSVA